MGGRSPTELILAWAEEAARAASDGTVSDENLWALVGRSDDAARSWGIARDGYLAMLDNLGRVRSGLVMKLIIQLRPTDGLAIDPPSEAELAREIDPDVPPAIFVVHDLVPRRDWELVEAYRRPLPSEPFLHRDAGGIQALYTVFRTDWEIEDDAPYRRELLFEHVSP